MDFISHVHRCNRHDLSGFRPFVVEGIRVGWLRHEFADALRAHGPVFRVEPESVGLNDRLRTAGDRTAAVAEVVETLAGDGRLPRPRRELYAVTATLGSEPLLEIDRAATTAFGVINVGFHLNGLVRRRGGDRMWVARRALDKTTYPGKLDNMVAGGQPSRIGFAENVIKECAEEAGIPEAMARRAVPTSVTSYVMEVPDGLRRHAMLAYDLAVPEDFSPVPVDGEVAEFRLLPAETVVETVRSELDAFKYNCNLIVIDWAIRTGRIGPAHPDYLALAQGLRRVLP